MPQVVAAFFRADCANEPSDTFAQMLDRPFGKLSQKRLHRTERHFNWVQVRRILRKIAQLCTRSFNRLSDSWNLVGRQIVHHNDIPAFEFGEQTLFDVGAEQFSGHRTFNHQRRDHCFAAQRSHKGHGLPMPLWHSPDQAGAAQAAAIQPHQVSADRGLVDEHQMRRVKQPLLSYPAPTRARHVGAQLFGRVQTFFYM